MDIISNLPDNVLVLILEKLSIVDQVRTSALSRNWRFKWTLVPSLELGIEFYDCFDTSGEGVSNVLECVNIINSLLMQHSGRLRRFFLSITVSDHPINQALYDNPIRFVSRIPGLERLEIMNGGLFPDRYTLPYSVFCAVGLTHLSLGGCQLCPPPSFGGFPNLVSLFLGSCTCTANVISWILSSCSQLQQLDMSPCFRDQTLHISAPKLRYLCISGSLRNIYLEKAEDLEKMNVDLFDLADGVAVGTSASTFQVFPDPCTKLCEITISNYVCKLLACCGGLQTLPVFHQLKKLRFNEVDLHDLDVFRCVLSILAHSPNLKALTMTLVLPNIDDSKMDHVVEVSEFVSMVEEYVVVGTNFGHLKDIVILNCKGTSLQMNMIELLLGISPVLEEMCIHIAYLSDLWQKEWLLRQMLSFSRASVKAKIIIR